MKNIMIWGTGDRARYCMQVNYFGACTIKGFVDTYSQEKQYMGYPIYKPHELVGFMEAIDYVVIANEFFVEILEICKKEGIDANKIVLTDNIRIEPYHTYYMRLKNVSDEMFSVHEKKPSILVRSNEYDCVDEKMLISKGKYSRAIYMEDYFRFRTFEFVAGEINKNGVPGDVAELGVFRGVFSALINEHFPDRTLYMFDTFEGFGSEEANEELDKGRCDDNFIIGHQDTTVERALNSLSHPEMAKICKGYFPDTITEEMEKAVYAFVSLDVDFEESTYQGLKFFYPRLSEGGMIFIHDYNTYYLGGIKKAVERYEKEAGIRLRKVPIADKAGTVIIVK